MGVFKFEFEKKYILNVVRDCKASEFVQLVQGSMTVSKYEAKFSELSRYAPQIISTEKEKTRKF